MAKLENPTEIYFKRTEFKCNDIRICRKMLSWRTQMKKHVYHDTQLPWEYDAILYDLECLN